MTPRPFSALLALSLLAGAVSASGFAGARESRRPSLPGTPRAAAHRSSRAFSRSFRWAGLLPLPTNSQSQPVPLTDATPSNASESEEEPAFIGQFESARTLLQDRFYGPAPKPGTLTHAAIRGMLKTLGDRYTRYLDPDEFRRMQEENSGEFGSVGLDLVLNRQNRPVVSKVEAASPASQAGVRVGDLLLQVSGHRLYPHRRSVEWSLDLLHGDPGTSVPITLFRKGRKAPLQFTLVRRMLYTPTVTARMLDRGVGYIKLTSFGERSDEEVGNALRTFHSRPLQGIILDLRGNPGGFFNAAVDIASRFVDKGPVVFTRDRERHQIPVQNIPSKRMRPRVPVAVLVDHWSASAAEIVAAAIQDTDAGVVIGEPTYGKALVQTINPLPDGSALLLTTHHYYTPRGTDISHLGVKPKIRLAALTDPTGTDLPLRRALSWLHIEAGARISARK